MTKIERNIITSFINSVKELEAPAMARYGVSDWKPRQSSRGFSLYEENINSNLSTNTG